MRNQLTRKQERERQLEGELGDFKLETDSLKHRINEGLDLLDNRERLLQLKDEDIHQLRNELEQSKDVSRSNLKLYEE